MSRCKIIMTGGGSAGHVTPNLALIPKLRHLGYDVEYIGTEDGIERKIISEENIKYFSISSGKLRRYFDIKNFTDPFKVIKGVFEAYGIVKRERPNVIFSKGGFVSVPVVIAGYLNKVPVVCHESDITPGLANKLAVPYATKVCVTFPEAMNKIKSGKATLTGTPIRAELFQGSREAGLKFCNFSGNKPVILVMGGSLGSKVINDAVRGSLSQLLSQFNIVHLCGKNNVDNALTKIEGYAQYEYVSKEIPDLIAMSDLIVSRAGANAIFEFLALKKPMLLIPLSKKSSRGDQILNAASFEKSGYSVVLDEDKLNCDVLTKKIVELYNAKDLYKSNMSKSDLENSVDKIIKIIENCKKC